MKINYKEPYWVKFTWDMTSNHDNQYVTEFNKSENDIFVNFLHHDKFIITCDFKIPKTCKTDKVSMVYGKPGMNLGLSYNKDSGALAFEFWTKSDNGNEFHFVPFSNVPKEYVEHGVTISVVRDGNKFIVYSDYEEAGVEEFSHQLIDDYCEGGLFVGCSNPGTHVPEHRYHGELEINYLAIIYNNTDINDAMDLYESTTYEILNKPYYNDIICLYNFKTLNNLGIVYDESKNCNFLEKVPQEFIAE